MKILLLSIVIGIASSTVIRHDSNIRNPQKYMLDTEIPNSILEKIKHDSTPISLKLNLPKGLQKMPNSGTSPIILNPNHVTDILLSDVNQVITATNIDPYSLATFEFLGISWNVTVGNFANLQRVGDASMTIYDKYNYEFNSGVGVHNLYGKFAFSITFFGITYQAGCNATVDTIEADVDFTVSINPADLATYVNVKSLRSTYIGKIEVEVYGLGILNPLAGEIANCVLNLFKSIIPIFFDTIFYTIVNQIANTLYPPWQ